MEVLNFTELDEFNSAFINRIEHDYPDEAKKFIRRQTNRAGRNYKASIPVKTGALKRGAKKNTKCFNGRYVGMIYNSAPHAHLVEDGHYNVDYSYTPGKHLLYNAMSREAPKFDSEVEQFIAKMLEF